MPTQAVSEHGGVTGQASSRYRRGTRQRGVIVEHRSQADFAELGRRIETWLRVRGFETEAIADERACLVKAEGAAGLKKTVGASPSLDVEIAAAPNGTKVSVRARPGRASGAEWTARVLAYSWVAYGMSFVNLRSALLEFVRAELRTHDAASQVGLRMVNVVETRRIDQPLGSEERAIDNANSDTTITRSIRATKRWTQSCQLGIEKSQVRGQSANVNLPNLASLRASMEETLREQYSASTQVEQVFEEEVTVTVPPRTSVHLIMDWKRIIQEGYIRLQESEGMTIDVPFEVAVSVTFDQRQL